MASVLVLKGSEWERGGEVASDAVSCVAGEPPLFFFIALDKVLEPSGDHPWSTGAV